MLRGVIIAFALCICAAGLQAKRASSTLRRPYRLARLSSAWRSHAQSKQAKSELHTRALERHTHRHSGRRLVVTRTHYPNFDARRRTLAYMNSIEIGLRKIPGYKRLRRSMRRMRRVAVIDYVFRRHYDGRAEIVMMRFLLHRGVSYTLTLATPAKQWGRWRRANRRLMRSFRPRRRR